MAPVLLLAGLLALIAAPAAADCTSDSPRHIRIGVSDSARPYVFPNADKGIEIDIVRSALAQAGYILCTHYQPNLRSGRLLTQGDIHGLLNVRERRHGGYLSDPVITFHNCVYTRRDQTPPVRALQDLKGKRVASFQSAHILMAPEFTALIPAMASYQEVADQSLQLPILLRRRVDALVMERQIFAYYLAKLAAKPEVAAQELTEFRHSLREACIFQPTPYRIEFAQEVVRDDFNRGLQQIRQTGAYDLIVGTYLTEAQLLD